MKILTNVFSGNEAQRGSLPGRRNSSFQNLSNSGIGLGGVGEKMIKTIFHWRRCVILCEWGNIWSLHNLETTIHDGDG
jgi:hypothetical protein